MSPSRRPSVRVRAPYCCTYRQAARAALLVLSCGFGVLVVASSVRRNLSWTNPSSFHAARIRPCLAAPPLPLGVRLRGAWMLRVCHFGARLVPSWVGAICLLLHPSRPSCRWDSIESQCRLLVELGKSLPCVLLPMVRPNGHHGSKCSRHLHCDSRSGQFTAPGARLAGLSRADSGFPATLLLDAWDPIVSHGTQIVGTIVVRVHLVSGSGRANPPAFAAVRRSFVPQRAQRPQYEPGALGSRSLRSI